MTGLYIFLFFSPAIFMLLIFLILDIRLKIKMRKEFEQWLQDFPCGPICQDCIKNSEIPSGQITEAKIINELFPPVDKVTADRIIVTSIKASDIMVKT